jgi:23S rRNA pseudouridine2605 synthase
MDERLQKILSQWGIASRRHAEQMIVEGRVQLNGTIARLGQRANPNRDQIRVDGRLIRSSDRPHSVYLLLHKPAGVVTTCRDPRRRLTVLDLLPESLKNYGLHPVGRLDADSTGALLLTNDGEVTFWLTHPRHAIAKTYHVLVRGHPSISVLQSWRQGVMLSGKQTLPADVEILRHQRENDCTLLRVVLREGRNRQIRRIASQIGHPVLQLQRIAIGQITLGKLPVGHYRRLTHEEIRFLHAQTSPICSSQSI